MKSEGRYWSIAGSLVVLAALAACGGGGSSSSADSGGAASSGATSSAASSAGSSASSSASSASSVSATSSTASATSSASSSVASSLAAKIALLDATLPSEPSLPASVCAILPATNDQSSFSGTNAQDPSIDNAAAVAASATASNPDTVNIQAALNACASGSAVKLTTSSSGHNAFLTGPLTLPSGVTLWVDSGVTVYASRYPADYEAGTSGYCGGAFTSTPSGSGCKALITVPQGASGSGIVGAGTIDGRGGSVLTGGPKKGLTWWDVAWTSKVSGYSSYSQNCPTMLDMSAGGKNFTLYKIALVNSPHFHVKIDSYNGVTAWNVKLLTPTLAYATSGYSSSASLSTTSLPTAPSQYYTPDQVKNTDGIDPGGSSNVTIAYSYISNGDDNIAVTASNSNSCVSTAVNGYCPSTTTKIAHNYLYYGHGMSVGSGTAGGVSGMNVWDLSIDGKGSSNGAGLRIKSYAGSGGTVSASYTKVCMQNEKQPIWVDPYYSSSSSTTLYPSFGTISYDTIHVVTSSSSATYTGGSVSMNGYSASYPATFTLDNIYFDTAPTWAAPTKASGWTGTTDYANFTIGSQSTYNFNPPVSSGTGDSLSGIPNSYSGTVLDCSAAFPTFSAATGRTDSPI
jgi:polygalacturonase